MFPLDLINQIVYALFKSFQWQQSWFEHDNRLIESVERTIYLVLTCLVQGNQTRTVNLRWIESLRFCVFLQVVWVKCRMKEENVKVNIQVERKSYSDKQKHQMFSEGFVRYSMTCAMDWRTFILTDRSSNLILLYCW